MALLVSQTYLRTNLPYQLYTDFKNGLPTRQSAVKHGLSVAATEERLLAAQLCFERQVEVKAVAVG